MDTLRLLAAAILTAASLGCGEPAPPGGDAGSEAGPDVRPPGWQATSLMGEPLIQREDSSGAVLEADARLAEDPENVELIIAAARVRRNVWQYRQAMELYTRAMELAPDDWRPYRYRGHRHISVREFPAAVRDLEAARDRAPLNWDVAYHLGLAYFLEGAFDASADEYLRCLGLADDPEALAAQRDDFRSCARNGNDPESYVAMSEWAVRALERAGRLEEVQAILREVPDEMALDENVAYHHDLLFHKGVIPETRLLEPGPEAPYRFETVALAVANHRIARGDTAGARALYRRIVQDPWWPGFGRIAAEAELARLR